MRHNGFMKAVIYARVSTILGQDPQHQIVPCRQLCENRDFDLVGEYVDFISGTAERRKCRGQFPKGPFWPVSRSSGPGMSANV